MARYIDADALLKKKDIITINDGNRAIVVGIVYEDDIEEAPTVDAVKHGEWIEKEVSDVKIEQWQSCKCSACGRYETKPYIYYFSESHYCSFCGAKMDGKGKEK